VRIIQCTLGAGIAGQNSPDQFAFFHPAPERKVVGLNRISDNNREKRVDWPGRSNRLELRTIYTIRRESQIGSANKCEAQMVELARRKPVVVFRMMDGEGQPIGEIVQPRTAPMVGRGAGTVLLVRENLVTES
jgi:hypothetical protein